MAVAMDTAGRGTRPPGKSLRRYLGRIWNDAHRFLPIVPINRPVPPGESAPPSGCACLVATRRGLFLVRRGRVHLLLHGKYYGLAPYRERWYTFQKFAGCGQLISFRLNDGRLVEPRRCVSSLSVGCHQMDFLDDRLYITDTYNNCLLVFVERDGRLIQSERHYPAGELSDGRASPNYVHVNSVWRNAEGVHLVFHNETSKTERSSEVILLDDRHQIARRIPTHTSNAHNVLRYGGALWICDSMDGSLKVDGRSVLETDKFTRGLAVSSKYVIVGGSDYGGRQARDGLKGTVYFLDHEFRLLHTLVLPGMVSEIRIIGDRDYGLSNCAVVPTA